MTETEQSAPRTWWKQITAAVVSAAVTVAVAWVKGFHFSSLRGETWVCAGSLTILASATFITAATVRLIGPRDFEHQGRLPRGPGSWAEVRVIVLHVVVGAILARYGWLLAHGRIGALVTLPVMVAGGFAAVRFSETRRPATGASIVVTWNWIVVGRGRCVHVIGGGWLKALDFWVFERERIRPNMSRLALVSMSCFVVGLASSTAGLALDGPGAPRAHRTKLLAASTPRPSTASSTPALTYANVPAPAPTVCKPITASLVDDDHARAEFQQAFDSGQRAATGCPSKIDSFGKSAGVAVLLGTCPSADGVRSAVVLTGAGAASLVYSGDFTARDPVVVVQAFNDAGVLTGTSRRVTVLGGDLYELFTTHGTSILARSEKVEGVGAQSFVNCSQVHAGGGHYSLIPPGLAALWMSAVQSSRRPLWVQEDPPHNRPGSRAFSLVDVTGTRLAAARCGYISPRRCTVVTPGFVPAGVWADDTTPVPSPEAIQSAMQLAAGEAP